MPADLLIVDGRVFRGFGPGEVPPLGSAPGPLPDGAPTAVAVAGGRITFVGDAATARREHHGPATRVIDARGGLVSAGFEDAHLHLLSGARSLDRIDLFGAETLQEIGRRVTAWADAHLAAPWVLGRGWFYVPFAGGLPTAAQLDALVPDRPAYLRCYDGHSGWANARALALAGVDASTPDPPNGRIVRDAASGEPTGAVLEAAQELLERILPSPTPAEDAASLGRAFAALAAAGITAVQDAWVEADDVALFRHLRDAGSLPLRVRLGMAMPSGIEPTAWAALLDRYDGARRRPCRGPLADLRDPQGLRRRRDRVAHGRDARPVRRDGCHGRARVGPRRARGRGGGRLAPGLAAGDPRHRRRGRAHGARRVRAGDAAGAGDPRARRHRVEHIETIDAADLPRFGALGVVASMQPFHAGSGARPDRDLGRQHRPRAGGPGMGLALHPGPRGAPRLRQRLAGGAVRPAHRPPRGGHPPDAGGRAARRLAPRGAADHRRGAGRLHPRLGLRRPCRARRGMIAVGRDADLVVLDRDLLAEDPSAIVGSRVVATVVDGLIVHGEGAA